MADDLPDEFKSYSEEPFGEFRLGRLKVGRVEFRDIRVSHRAGFIGLQELLLSSLEKTRRARVGKDGTRYPEPLPMAAPARMLSVEITDYLRDMKRRNLQLHTIDATARALKILLTASTDIPVSRVDHQHIHAMWDLLRWAPRGFTKSPDLKHLDAETLIALGKSQGVQPRAVRSLELHRGFLATFFKTLVTAHAIAYSPMSAFREMKKDLVEDEEKAARIFDPTDMKRIFNPSTFIPWARKYPHRWWAPMIGLYTGARVGEVAQLKVKDIVYEDGAWCIAIRKTLDDDLRGSAGQQSRQRLKGKSAVRKVPIAQPLLEAGILLFLEDMKAFGHPRLFPHLSSGVNKTTGESNSRYSQSLMQQFAMYLKELGFPKGLGFHGFRHAFATGLEAQGVREEEIALITGHCLAKRVPVLQDAYIHAAPERVRSRQLAALEMYAPPVELPVYVREQFRECLCRGAKLYP